MKRFFLFIILLAGTAQAETSVTQVVLLGTGTPNAEPNRSGAAIAIVVNDVPYLVDFGPGVVRRAAAASPRYGGPVAGLDIANLRIAFLSHLHSDHTAGLPDLLLTPWVEGRDVPLQLYGPDGIEEMAHHIVQAYEADIDYRLHGSQPANEDGWRIEAYTLDEGVVYKDEQVTVEAFRVRHGSWENAFGFRFTTPDRVIVISGDAAPDDNLERYAKGADILLHEVYSDSGFLTRPPEWQAYHRTNHTSASELGEIAERAKPGLLVLYHILFWGSSGETLLEEVRSTYSGEVVLGNDLDVY
ncbi:MAG: MBL fold metallo-hydrolase [Pseudomonadota bacterium]